MQDDETVIATGEPATQPGPAKPAVAPEYHGSPGVQINESDLDDPFDPDSPSTENDVT
jgi:hypothetical protein